MSTPTEPTPNQYLGVLAPRQMDKQNTMRSVLAYCYGRTHVTACEPSARLTGYALLVQIDPRYVGHSGFGAIPQADRLASGGFAVWAPLDGYDAARAWLTEHSAGQS